MAEDDDLPEWWEYRDMVYWRRGPWRTDKTDSQIEASILRSSENLAVIVRGVGKGLSKIWATFTREKNR